MTTPSVFGCESPLGTVLQANTPIWEACGRYPLDLHLLASRCNALSLGYEDWFERPDRIAQASYNAISKLVRYLTENGSQGIAMGLASHVVALRVLYSGQPGLYQDVARSVLSGEALICLALAEPQTGSSLRNIQVSARSPKNGSCYVTGEKVFVCNGSRAKWIVTTAMLDDTLGLWLVERDDSVTHQELSCLGWRSLPIAHVTFHDTPARLLARGEHALASLKAGLVIERMNLSVMAAQAARCTTVDATNWALSRDIDGTLLVKKQAIAHRLAEMGRLVSILDTAIDSMIERVESAPANEIAVVKNTASKTLEYCAREAVQILGAHGCFQPSSVERTFRDSKLVSIGGGSEEIMNEIICHSFSSVRAKKAQYQ